MALKLKWFSIKTVATIFRVTPKMVRNWCKEGKLAHRKVKKGNKTTFWIPDIAVDEFLRLYLGPNGQKDLGSGITLGESYGITLDLLLRNMNIYAGVTGRDLVVLLKDTEEKKMILSEEPPEPGTPGRRPRSVKIEDVRRNTPKFKALLEMGGKNANIKARQRHGIAASPGDDKVAFDKLCEVSRRRSA